MVRCVEYYDKCEREGCDWCEKDPTTVAEIQEYIKLYKDLEILGVPRTLAIARIPEGAARPLIRNRNEDVRAKALSSISNALESGKHPVTGKFLKDKQITVKVVEAVIEDIEIELRNERMDEELAE